MSGKTLALLLPLSLAGCFPIRPSPTAVALNPNVELGSISKVAVPYSAGRGDPGEVERNILPALSAEQGLLFLGYDVIDRGDIDAVLREHELSLAGLAAQREAAEISRILGIEGLVIPSVAPGDEPNVKLIDIATGRIVWNVNGPQIFHSLAEALKEGGWNRFPPRRLAPVEKGSARAAFSRNAGKAPVVRLGVVPLQVGHGVSWGPGASLTGGFLVRLDGGHQADRIAGDLLAAGFDVVERTHLSRVMEELKLDASGLLRRENALRIGEMLNVQALVMGAAYNDVSNPTVAVKFVDLRTGEVLCVYKGRRSAFGTMAKEIRAALAGSGEAR